MMAERMPIIPVMMYGLLSKVASNVVPNALSAPVSDTAATVVSMPRKNNIVLRSILCRRAETSGRWPGGMSWYFFCLNMNSVTVQSTARISSMPIKGGRSVTNLNTGTRRRPPTPTQNTATLSPELISTSVRLCALPLSSFLPSLPLRKKLSMTAGTITDTSAGRNRAFITPNVLMLPLTHSIMVVTSPIGENAPPLLAATMIIDT